MNEDNGSQRMTPDRARQYGAIRPFPDTAELMNMSRSLVYDAIRRGEIPSIRIGRRVLVPVAPLLRLLGADPQPEPTRLQIETKSIGGPLGYAPGASRADY